MGIFACKHKEVRIITCNKKDKFYIVQCLKCMEQMKLPKAEGEMYQVATVVRRW